MKRWIVALLVAVVLAGGGFAHAAIVTYAFTGYVTDFTPLIDKNTGNILGAGSNSILGIVPGDTLTGSFNIDPTVPVSSLSPDGKLAFYNDALADFALQVGSVGFFYNSQSKSVTIVNDTPADAFYFSCDSLSPIGHAVTTFGAQFFISDSTGSMYSDVTLDNATHLTLPTQGNAHITLYFDDTIVPHAYQAMRTQLTTLTETPAVPEPASIVVWSSLGAVGLVMLWRRRRVNSAT